MTVVFLITLAVLVIFLFVLQSKGETVTFPEGFKIGAASSSYQIEGAWDEDGKSPNIWDVTTHNNPGFTADWTNGDVAAESYHMYQKDIAALANIGFDTYRFSISWARIIPDGSRINMKGIEYYSKLINGLIEKGIEPMVTMYHWDLPQYIQDLGGWTNPLIVDYFREYADALFLHFGSRVKRWITVNEPSIFCRLGYGSGVHAPAIRRPGVADYLCSHHVLLVNAAVYHLYKEKYFEQQKGQVGICLNVFFSFPFNETVDQSVADKSLQFDLGKFAHPIFSTEGGYPQVMIDEIALKSKAGGYPWSRLPVMTDEQKKYIKGTADFMAINYYSSRLVYPTEEDPSLPISWDTDKNIDRAIDPSWKRAKSPWLFSVPDGLHDLLVWVKDNYDNPTMMITENGWSDDGRIEDNDRVDYLKSHLAAVARAINDEGCNVVAYMVWSLIDNFEWASGYTERFGIHYIDFHNKEKTRIPKNSAKFFKQMMPTRSFEL